MLSKSRYTSESGLETNMFSLSKGQCLSQSAIMSVYIMHVMHSSDISTLNTAYDKMLNVLSQFHVPPGADGHVKAKCRHCSVVISGHTKTTSNFVKHIRVSIHSHQIFRFLLITLIKHYVTIIMECYESCSFLPNSWHKYNLTSLSMSLVCLFIISNNL